MATVCITIDVEGDSSNNPHSTFFGIEIVLPQLIKLFDKYDIKVTFFIQDDEISQIGSIFLKLWKSLENQGYEIGYHAHGLIRASIKKKEDIITKGLQKLKKIGLNPISFRAGRYHFNGSFLKILEKNNIKYDSSVIPGLRECFNDEIVRCDHIGAPYEPYFPSYENHCLDGNSRILELPINRYPKLSSNRWGGILTGGSRDEEILFDYFYEIRKDKVIIIAFHSWDGLFSIIKRIVRNEKYGKIKRFVFKSIRKVIDTNFFISSGYITRFDTFLRYVSEKNDIHFTTIREAGESIVRSKLQ